jgi:hypothetical protein
MPNLSLHILYSDAYYCISCDFERVSAVVLELPEAAGDAPYRLQATARGTAICIMFCHLLDIPHAAERPN